MQNLSPEERKAERRSFWNDVKAGAVLFVFVIGAITLPVWLPLVVQR